MILTTVSIPPKPAEGFLGFNATLARVNVFLGANGTGKSRILKHIVGAAPAFWPNRPIVYVEGGRVILIPEDIPGQDANWGEESQAQVQQYRQKHGQKLAVRIKGMFSALVRRGRKSEREHYKLLNQWAENGAVGEPPKRGQNDLQKLFRLFNQIFPEITLSLEGNKVFCSKGGASYRPSALSDGERQVLSILGDVALLADANSVILIDEPELNLHPSLACQLWDLIEGEKPKATFVYATHSLLFATRPLVDKIIVLGGQKGEPLLIEDISAIPPNDLENFLGPIPAILKSSRALGVEGRDVSFDRDFYAWLIGESGITVVPLGSCDDVYAATTKTGIWTSLAPGVYIRGVIDRDFRTDAQLANVASENCLPIEYHEAESYLCHPTLLAKVADELALKDPIPTFAEILNEIRDWCRRDLYRTVLARVASACQVRLAPSVPNKLLDGKEDDEKVLEALRQASTIEYQKAFRVSPEEVARVFESELTTCRHALDSNDPDLILRLFPGKGLATHLAKFIGCADHQALLRTARRKINPCDYPHLDRLRSRIREVFALPPGKQIQPRSINEDATGGE